MSGASTGSAAPAAATRARPRAGVRQRLLSPPWMFAGLITLIIVVGEWYFDVLGGYGRVPLALGGALAAEIVLSLAMHHAWPRTLLSAYISGNSVLLLTKPAAGADWIFAMAAVLAIMSKYVLRYRGQHLWNPTNFAISLLLLVAPGTMAILSHQWSNSPVAVAIIFSIGLTVVYRARLLHITGTYIAAFCALAWLRAQINGNPVATEIAPLTGPMYTLLVFFMITDPKTVVAGTAGRVVVVLLIALLECAIRLAGDANVGAVAPLLTAPPLFALAIVGPIAKALDIRRRAAAPPRS